METAGVGDGVYASAIGAAVGAGPTVPLTPRAAMLSGRLPNGSRQAVLRIATSARRSGMPARRSPSAPTTQLATEIAPLNACRWQLRQLRLSFSSARRCSGNLSAGDGPRWLISPLRNLRQTLGSPASQGTTVGAARFELATSSSQPMRAAKLRHARGSCLHPRREHGRLASGPSGLPGGSAANDRHINRHPVDRVATRARAFGLACACTRLRLLIACWRWLRRSRRTTSRRDARRLAAFEQPPSGAG